VTPPCRRVAVLFGGISAEREVSLVSGRQCIAALRGGGFEVTPILVGPDLGAVIAALEESRPDVVFNALHGRFGEDGTIQGVLDWMGLPYTHSGVRASALAMDKEAAKAVFAAAGLPVARGRVVSMDELEAADPLPLPYVVKPVNEGSSVGVEIMWHGDNRRAELARTWRYDGRAMVEEYVPGRELTVGVMGERALAVTEIAPQGRENGGAFYDYEAKYADGGSRHAVPAPVHPVAYAEAMGVALAAHRALGCRGASRADLRYDDTAGEPGRLVLLEVNTQPGLTPTSLLPEQAAHLGISFPALCAWMVENASCRA
jgi:D-alanine-D-alanine ligase